jgi:hypothetical protein
LKCSINCTNPQGEGLVRACELKTSIETISYPSNRLNKSICSGTDVLAGRWVKVYWGSDEECGEGYVPKLYPGFIENRTCCSSSQRCNAPGATPPSIKCFGIKSSPTSGYCTGKTASFSVCAASQTRADERAALFAMVRTDSKFLLGVHDTDRNAQFIGYVSTTSQFFMAMNCSAAVDQLCAQAGGKVRLDPGASFRGPLRQFP